MSWLHCAPLNLPAPFMTKIVANLDQEWIKKISSSRSGLVVFSPYITPNDVVDALAERGAKVYTRFSLRDFASGASSLDAIEELAESCDLYEVADLHAKIIMDGSTFATVGSQNLTYKGANVNKEMNLSIKASELPKGYATLRRTVEKWIAGAVLIDRGRIMAMRKQLEIAEEAYGAFKSKIASLQKRIDRETAAAALKQTEADRKTQANRTRRAVNEAVRVAESIHSQLDAYVVESGDKTPFLFFRGQRLTSFNRDGETVPIEPLTRIMCLMPNGQFRWARLAPTQITRFGSFLQLGNVLADQPGLRLTATTSKRSIEHGPAATNLVILVRSEQGLMLCRIPIRFRLKTLKILAVMPCRKNKETRQFLAWLTSNQTTFRKLMLTMIGQPSFADEPSKKLYGRDAKRVIGPHGTHATIRVLECNSHPLLVIDRPS